MEARTAHRPDLGLNGRVAIAAGALGAVLALIAVAATATARRFPGAGLFVSGLFLLLCAPSAFLAGITFH